MRYVTLILLFLMLNVWGGFSYWSSAAIAIWIWYLWELFENVNERIAFKEFILTLYGLNYLFSPALTYLLNPNGTYRMKLPEDEYFMIAIPCMFLLQLGMNSFKTKIFRFEFKTVRLHSMLNQSVLVSWLYAGIVLSFLSPLMPSDFAFFVYLLSGIRFVAAFGLFVLDAKRYKWHLIAVLVIELLVSLRLGMFHDFVMWVIFFGLFWIYLKKPSKGFKIIVGICAFLCIYILQVAKADYRTQVGQGGEEAGLSTLQEAVSKNVEDDQGLFNKYRLTNSITRVNQAWILASTVNRMNKVQDFQQLAIVSKYAEAAFFPRFLAPNKMVAGDRSIFNRFSGHYVTSATSMGLGFFADGYIAYGQQGVYVFAFILGFIFSIIFKIVEHWAKVSPFFIFFMFPILNFAVRPDCETQTIMGHIVKGLFVFGCLMWYYNRHFSRKLSEVQMEIEQTAYWRRQNAKRISINH